MKLQQLFETIDNLFDNDTEQRAQYAQQVYDMIQKSYASQGGMKGSGFDSPKDMINSIPMWKLYRTGNDVKAVMMYKDRGGRKRVAIATDGSQSGKVMLFQMLKDEAKTQRAFVELSGRSLAVHKKLLGDKLNDLLVPAKKVQSVLPDDEIKTTDDPHTYSRNINGEWVEKVMLGRPHQPIK